MSRSSEAPLTYVAFAGNRSFASGDLETVLSLAKRALDDNKIESLLIFDEQNGKQRDFNFRGSLKEVLERVLPAKGEGSPGRPKLGVTCREISLLPRHWDWLDQQPQGASASLRRLIDEARKREPNKAEARRVREAAGNIMWAMGGDLVDFEEASRALYAADLKKFKTLVAGWPKDIRDYFVGRLKLAVGLESGLEPA